MKFYYFHPDSLKNEDDKRHYVETLVIHKDNLEHVFNVEDGKCVYHVNKESRFYLDPSEDLTWKKISKQKALKFLIKYGATVP